MFNSTHNAGSLIIGGYAHAPNANIDMNAQYVEATTRAQVALNLRGEEA